MADDATIRVKRPDGRYSTIPVESLKAAVARGYTYVPTAATKPATPPGLTGPPAPVPFAERFTERVGDIAQGTEDMPSALIDRSRELYKQGADKGGIQGILGRIAAIPRAEGETLGGMAKGVGSVTTPGLVGRIASKEDPAAISADMATFLAGQKAGGEPVRTGLGESAELARKGVSVPTASLLQRLSGAGKEPVLMEAIKRRDAMTKAAAEHTEKLADLKRQQATAETQTKYADSLQKNIQQTYKTVKSRLDSRWHGLRSTTIQRGPALTILKDEPLSSKAIADTVSVAEKKFLQGSPESIKQFRDLMNWMREDTGGASASMVDAVGGAEPALRPITWDEARTHYSALGNRLASGDLPGNVKQAIRYVRSEGLGSELKAGATRANALPQYESLLSDHAQFEDDWHNMSSVTRGEGSPLAVALKAPNSATLIPQVIGKTGDLLIKRLAKYQDAGASPATAAAIRKLGTVNVPKEPSAPRTPPPVDPVAIRRWKMLQYSGKPKRYYDYLPPNFPTEQLLSVDKIREWVARQPRKELPLPKETP